MFEMKWNEINLISDTLDLVTAIVKRLSPSILCAHIVVGVVVVVDDTHKARRGKIPKLAFGFSLTLLLSRASRVASQRDEDEEREEGVDGEKTAKWNFRNLKRERSRLCYRWRGE